MLLYNIIYLLIDSLYCTTKGFKFTEKRLFSCPKLVLIWSQFFRWVSFILYSSVNAYVHNSSKYLIIIANTLRILIITTGLILQVKLSTLQLSAQYSCELSWNVFHVYIGYISEYLSIYSYSDISLFEFSIIRVKFINALSYA